MHGTSLLSQLPLVLLFSNKTKIESRHWKINLIFSRKKTILLLQCINGGIFRCSFNLKEIINKVMENTLEHLKSSGDNWHCCTLTGFLKQALWSFRTCISSTYLFRIRFPKQKGQSMESLSVKFDSLKSQAEQKQINVPFITSPPSPLKDSNNFM